jgi:hypothetical protein
VQSRVRRDREATDAFPLGRTPCGGALCRAGTFARSGAQSTVAESAGKNHRKAGHLTQGALLDRCRKGWRVRVNERKQKLNSPISPQEGQSFLQDLARLVAADSLNLGPAGRGRPGGQ